MEELSYEEFQVKVESVIGEEECSAGLGYDEDTLKMGYAEYRKMFKEYGHGTIEELSANFLKINSALIKKPLDALTESMESKDAEDRESKTSIVIIKMMACNVFQMQILSELTKAGKE